MLYSFKNHWKNTIALQLYVNKGASVEKKGDFGITHFTEHCIFGKTEKFSANVFDKECDRVFHSIRATTSLDYVLLSCYFDVSDFDKAIELISEMFFSWKLDKKLFNRFKKEVIEETKEFLYLEETIIRKKIGKFLNFERINSLGTVSSLKNIKFEDTRKLKKHWDGLMCEPIDVFVVGNITNEQKDLINKKLKVSKNFHEIKNFLITKSSVLENTGSAILFYESGKAHFCDVLLQTIFDVRTRKIGNNLISHYLRKNNKSIFSVVSLVEKNISVDSFILKKIPSRLEFEESKEFNIKCFNSIFDMVDVFEGLNWFGDFYQGNYFPDFLDPLMYVDYLKNLSYEEFLKVWNELFQL